MSPVEEPRTRLQVRHEQRHHLLFLLFEGPTGRAHMAHLREGGAVGRHAMLRAVPARVLHQVAEVVEAVRAVSHPSASKVLELVEGPDGTFVASEYIDGVTLHELEQAARHKHTSVAPKVATRIIHDALQAAADLAGLLNAPSPLRYLFSDTVWVAEYGATLLSEPGVAALLHQAHDSHESHERELAGGLPVPQTKANIRAAGSLLSLLLHGPAAEPLQADLLMLGDELARIAGKAASDAYESERHMALELACLPRDLFGTEDDVAAAVRSLVSVTLETRRQLTLSFESGGDRHSEETAFISSQVFIERRVSDESTSAPQPPPGSGERRLFPSAAALELELDEPEVDDQERTIAFRPSRIPKAFVRSSAAPAAPQAEPESDPELVMLVAPLVGEEDPEIAAELRAAQLRRWQASGVLVGLLLLLSIGSLLLLW